MTTKRRYLGILIVALALVAGLTPWARATNVLRPTLIPPTGQTHLKSGDVVTFGGEVTPGATVQLANLVMKDESGAEVRRLDVSSETSISGDAISGTRRMGNVPAEATSIEYVVSVAHQDGTEQTAASPAVPVDQVRPRIELVEAVATDQVRITFSEPILSPTGNQALDWRVDDLIPVEVAGDPEGDVRYLRLLAPVGEDETPSVMYVPRSPLGEPYRDGAGNTLGADNTLANAKDLIPPRLPVIETIDGKSPRPPRSEDELKSVISRSSGPTIFVEEATQGHMVVLSMESNGSSGLQTTSQDDVAADTQLGSEVAGADGVSFDVGEGTFSEGTPVILYTQAQDTAEQPNLSEVDIANYEVDVTAPVLQAAKSVGKNIVVTFSEPLATGRDLATDWTVQANGNPIPVVRVLRTGDTVTLETLDRVPGGTTVSYTPPAEDGYADEAGNALDAFLTVVTEGLIAKIVDATPEVAERGVAKVHTITASVTDQAAVAVPGTLVGFRAIEGPTASTNADGNEATPPGVIGSCFTQSNGTCRSEPFTSFAVGIDTIQTWIDTDRNLSTIEYQDPEDNDVVETDEQDVVEVTWTAKGADLRLDASPETSSQRLVFTKKIEASVTAVPTSDLFPPVTGATEVKGVNVDMRVVMSDGYRYVGDCFTGSDGSCEVTVRGTKAAIDRLQVWIDRDQDDDVDENDELLGDGLYVEDKAADGFVVIDDPAQDVVEVGWSLGLKSLSLKAPRRTTQGDAVRLTGVVGGDAACRATSVAIVRRIVGKRAKTIKTLKSFSGGRWSYKFRPRYNATYEARSNQTTRCESADSTTKKIAVRTKVSRHVADNTLRPGQKAVITGGVTPWKKGRTVQLMMKRGRRWHVVRRDRLNRHSRYRFAGYFAGAGTRYFRVRYTGDRLNDPGNSKVFRLKVSRDYF
jgi:hypothetical protein